MATPLDPKQVVTIGDLILSQVVQQKALTTLLVKKGIFTKDECLELVKVVLPKSLMDVRQPGRMRGSENKDRRFGKRKSI